MRSRVLPRRAFGSLVLGLALLTLGPLAACSAATHAAQATPATQATHPPAARGVDIISVDPATVTRVIPAGFFGINYSGFWDSAQGSQASANALKQTPIRSVRFAGGDPADWYDWQEPYYPTATVSGSSSSSTSPVQLARWAAQFGATPLFQTNYQGHLPNPPGQSYTVNSPQNQAAWVSYDQAHGIDARMEVGNEEDIHMKTHDDPDFQPYITAFNAQASAMHAVDPNVQVYGPAGTNEYYWWTLDSLGMFLKQTGNKTGTGEVDGVSLHYYKGTDWNSTKGAAQTWNCSHCDWPVVTGDIAANDTHQLPVDISEWNLGDADNGTGFNQTAGHALVYADMIGAFAQSGVAEEDYFDLHGAKSYGLLYGTGEARPVDTPTPTYYATALWGHMGANVLPLTQSANPSTTVSAYATSKSNGSVQVLAINKTGSPRPVQINYTGFSPQNGTLSTYTMASTTDENSLDVIYDGQLNPSAQKPLPGPISTTPVTANTVSVTLAPYSATILDVTAR
jgi:hypothetical protein